MPNEQDSLSPQKMPKGFNYEPETIVGKRVVVTGGSTGIGRATALLLVARGAKALIFGRSETELNDAVAQIKGVGGGEIYGITADVSKPEEVKRVFEEADRRLGGVDILINNAAVGAGSILDSDYDEWNKAIQINLTGALQCCKEAADRMRKNKDGHIINVGSMSAKTRGPGSDIYVATKSGLRGFTDSLAKKLNEEGIRVTLVEPGLVGTDMTTEDVSDEEQAEQVINGTMLRTEDLAQCIYYCLIQPRRCNVAMMQIRPTRQII